MPFTIVLAFDTFAYSACSSLVVEATLEHESLRALTDLYASCAGAADAGRSAAGVGRAAGDAALRARLRRTRRWCTAIAAVRECLSRGDRAVLCRLASPGTWEFGWD